MDLKKEFQLDRKHIFTVPNILSYLRIILIAPFVGFFVVDEYVPAAICLIASALSDCVDGFLARKLNQVTQLGKMLDPVADKLTLLAVGVCICIKEPIVIPTIVIMMIKDIAMIIGASVLIKKGLMPTASKWYGKVGTVCFYVSVTVIVVFQLVLPQFEGFEPIPWFPYVSITLLTITTIIMLYSLFKYAQIFRKMLRDEKQKETLKKD
ncbi:MAG: CDP-alcohol phosphatidyltransferase family protein [Eubacteriales bacterium]|nr:CDP-alcohol phosphatidyltransferase family protein [Eubacteriales bacterium]